jgi:hypothetical protein
MKRFIALAFTVGCLTSAVSAAVTANTIATGTAYMTYDRAAWAMVAPFDAYTDISGTPTGASGPTADATGQRWMFPDRFEGTSWVNAAYPAAYLTGGATTPLTQPSGGFALAVNTYGVNSFASGHKITTFNSSTAPNGFIGLGGSLRVTSDFNEPGASVWWQKLALQFDSTDSTWKIVSTFGAGAGTVFELTNVVTDTINGSLYLSADYKFGNSDWYQFLQSSSSATISQTAILGHIELIPTGVPEPSRALLLLTGVLAVALRRRR